ncbi:MAG: MdtA/MuxA family multidrug efflux RND transporter periplasmic adaptor subunit [Geothrix sp.]|nr:MdtA/MuxA family multidrug efflux RND transporter periplasmic adaptor subunit [Geothrix sp.]
MATLTPDAPPPSPSPVPSSGFFLRWRLRLGLGAVVLVILILWAIRAGRSSSAPPAAGRSVPVVVTAARKGDMNVNLTGLGTVTPLTTVTVHSRVDGELMRVAFTEGQMVHQGDLLAQIDPRPFQVQLMQAEGQLAKDQAALKNARMDLDRFQSLVKQGILAQQQLDAQTSTVVQAEGAIKSDESQVESAKLNLVYSRITAPISGRVGLRLVDLGNMVHASDANGLAVISAVQPITVIFTIPADNIQQVLAQNRKTGKLMVEAWDRDMTSRLAVGTLAAIDNQADVGTGTVRLRALFANEDMALFPNQFVNAKLLVDTLRDMIIVPSAAVQRSPQATFVYVAKADNTVELRPVVVQATDGDQTCLSRGLAPGEKVVVDGLDKLRPGSKVVPTDAEGQGTANGTKAKG